MDSRALGQWGEERAARYLRLHGYRIVARNFSCRMGEVDIIAAKRGFLAFVEVKTRSSRSFAEAREFVSAAKQRRVRTAALCYLAKNPTERQPRFDIIEVYTPECSGGRRTEINHIENAFE